MADWLTRYAQSEQGREAARKLGLARKVHGHSKSGTSPESPTYRSWRAMNQRCHLTSGTDYARYGGRGIAVSPRWRGPEGFVNFLADMGERPEGMTLDRIDNDGDYGPANCRWADGSTQRLNFPQPRGWKIAYRPQTPSVMRAAECRRCGVAGEVRSRAKSWTCAECKPVIRAEVVARHRARAS